MWKNYLKIISSKQIGHGCNSIALISMSEWLRWISCISPRCPNFKKSWITSFQVISSCGFLLGAIIEQKWMKQEYTVSNIVSHYYGRNTEVVVTVAVKINVIIFYLKIMHRIESS